YGGDLAACAGGVDVVMIGAWAFNAPPLPAPRVSAVAGANAGATAIRWDRYGWAVLISALCTLFAFAMYRRFELSNLVMIYLLGVTVAGLRLGRGPSPLTAGPHVPGFDFLFLAPAFSFPGSA